MHVIVELTHIKNPLVDYLIEVRPDVGIPEKVKLTEERWSEDEFLRYSTAILAGFFDALNSWRRGTESVESGEERGEEVEGFGSRPRL